MKRNLQIATAGLWLAPVILFFQNWLVWDRLPQRMAVHFAADGHPTGWMPKEMAAWLPVVPMLGILLAATIVLVRVSKPDAGSWALVILFYTISGCFVVMNQQLIQFSLDGTPINLWPVLGVVFIVVAVCAVVSIWVKSAARTY